MKPRSFVATLLLLFSAQFITAAEWIPEENWVEKGWFGSINYLETALSQEKAEKYSNAANAYEMVYRLASNPENKAHALYSKAVNQQRAGKSYEAYKTYKELINRYPAEEYFTAALNNMFEIGKSYEATQDKMFSDNRRKALEIYSTIIETAPYSDNAPEILLRTAKLQETSVESEKAITSYERIIKKYKNFETQSSAAYLNLANVYDEMAQRADCDCKLTKKSLHLVDTFQARHPDHERKAEAGALKEKLRNRLGMYYYNLGEFYTWEANYSIKATRRYLHKVLFEYLDTPAAAKAEQLLASVDPNSATIVAEAKEKNKMVKKKVSKQDIKLLPFTKSQKESLWEKEEAMPVEDQDSDKWLLPIPNIKGDK